MTPFLTFKEESSSISYKPHIYHPLYKTTLLASSDVIELTDNNLFLIKKMIHWGKLVMLKQGMTALSTLGLSILSIPALASLDCNLSDANFRDKLKPISEIQGTGNSSSLINTEVVVKGMLTGDFTNTLGGYFVQNYGGLDASGEGGIITPLDTTKSHAIFVSASSLPANASTNFTTNLTNEIVVHGTVIEKNGQTQLSNTTALVCDTGNDLPVLYDIPNTLGITDWGQINWETLEGMRVTFPQKMVITSSENLEERGQLTLSPQAWLDAPLQHGTQTLAKQTYNQSHQIILDDGTNTSKPNPLNLAGYDIGFNPANKTLIPQAGSSFGGQQVEGIVYQDTEGYRLQVTHLQGAPSITRSTDSSDALTQTSGDMLLAYFNLDHYFNGQNGSFSTSYGAQNAAEYQSQKSKVSAAIAHIQADIIALTGLENDYDANNQSSIAELASENGYEYLKPEQNLGNDSRAVGVLYKSAKVETWGKLVQIDNQVENSKNRPTLIQTFAVKNNTKKRLTLAVTHLACDIETTNNTSTCQDYRSTSINNLIKQLQQDPTKTEDEDFIIVGNFNTYAKDELITQALAKGYTNHIAQEYGSNIKTHYNSGHNGQWGTLDYILTSTSLTDTSQVSDAGIWHINSKESELFDYRLGKPNQTHSNWITDGAFYRFAKRDPLLIALNLLESNEPNTITPDPEPTPPPDTEPAAPEPTTPTSSSGGGSIPLGVLLLAGLVWIRRHLKI